MPVTLRDLSRGSLLGAFIGDAAGGVLEFGRQAPTTDEIEDALRFPGGGMHALAPGQITDDGELTICLARGLQETACSNEPTLEAVAREYYHWVTSRPFDIGNTTDMAMGACSENHKAQGQCAQVMRAAAADRCMTSKANGSLMRATPLAIWGHALPVGVLAEWARADSRLSHPNVACTDSVAAYVIAIAHLLNHPGDSSGAIATAKTWTDAHASEEVQSWLALALAGQPTACTPQDGFAKIAFTHAFHHLHIGSNYSEAIRQTLAGGGDTDTNACIVGGLIGALHGAEAIPQAWRDAVLSCDTKKGQSRPPWLFASSADEHIDALLERASATQR
tara:strand:- start:21504 stop:22508 length:1005 start_codon:yes stop_codon:yes gene_type:complete